VLFPEEMRSLGTSFQIKSKKQIKLKKKIKVKANHKKEKTRNKK